MKKSTKTSCKRLLAVVLIAFIFVARLWCAQVELLSNRGFESGASSFWFRNGDSGIFQGSYPHLPGTWYGFLGNTNNAIGSIHQFINIPTNASSATLTFYLNVVTYETGSGTTFDKMDVNFRHATTDALLKKWKTYSESDKGGNIAGQYTQKTISFSSSDLSTYKGQTVLLQFYGTTDYADFTIFRIDDLSFIVTTDDAPAAPSYIETAGYDDHIDLGWTDSSSNETGFKIERKVNNGSFSQIATAGVNEYLYTDNAVSGCNVYTYRVRAYNSAGNSAYSPVSANFLRPAAPNNLVATPSSTAIGLAWQENACNEDGIRVDRKTGVAGSWNQIGDFGPNTVGVTDNSASLGVTYYYRVYAYNASGNSAYSSEVSASRTQTYTVGVSAGSNGTVTPSGNVLVTAGNNLDLSATPASNYIVDQWLVNGVVQQTGGTSFTLSSVAADKTVSVTFKLKTYNLVVDAGDAEVTITPLLSAYPHGGSVTVTINPHAGRIFVQWNGTFQSLEQSLTFPMERDISLAALLRNISSPTRIQTANSTSPTSFDIVYPTSDGYIYVLEFSENGRFWKPVTVKTGQNAGDAIYHISTTGGSEGYYRVRQTAFYYLSEGFLQFPISDGNSATSRITSILDHHGKISYAKDGAILTYKGQLATVEKFAYGLRTIQSVALEPMSSRVGHVDYFGNFYLAAFGKNSAGSDFDLGFAYEDAATQTPGHKGLLFYDGHPGYDYAYNKNTEIHAAAKGRLIPSLCGGVNNQIVIQHLNGYRTFYLHCDNWSDYVTTAKNSNQEADIYAGQLIGYVGDKGAATGAYHLHFEVHRYSAENGAYVLADPYGHFAEDGSQIDPPLWITGE